MAGDGRIEPRRIGGPGAAPGDTLVWDGAFWKPGAAGASVTVSPDEPPSPQTGDLWYDTDATC